MSSKKHFFVYIHIFPDGRKYVGKTLTSLSLRWRRGQGYKEQSVVFNEIIYWGWINLKHEVWEVDSEEEMEYLEKYLISFYETLNPRKGLNRTSGGTNYEINLGSKRYWSSPENRKKHSDKMKAFWTPERRKEVGKKIKATKALHKTIKHN